MTSWILFFLLFSLGFIVDFFFHSKKKSTMKESVLWSIFWTLIAFGFNAWIYFAEGREPAIDFFTAYLVERNLSLDNLFVFLLIFKAFAIPHDSRYKVLFWGIFGAFIMRALFITGGIFLLTAFHPILYVFGAFLIYSGIKMFKAKQEEIYPEKNPIIMGLEKWFPVTHDATAKTFFVKKDKIYYATPLFLALVAIETTDVIFALDSIPAVLGITTDPLIVFTSNMFAILGLRSLYFVLERSFDYFHYLHYGLSCVLIFIGFKMVASDFIHISTELSLGLIIGILGISIAASWLKPPQNKASK